MRTGSDDEPLDGLIRRVRATRSSAAVAAVVLAWSLVLPSLAGAGAWTPAGPVNGLYVVATHPTAGGQAMIGGGYGSLTTWFSGDGGATWTGNPWRSASYRPVLAGHPTVAWMVRRSQLLRSTDNGRSWGIVDLSLPQTIEALAVNPDDPDEVVVGGSAGVAVTRDGGRSWAVDPAAGEVLDMAVDWTTRRVLVTNGGDAAAPPPPLRRRSLEAPGWTALLDNARWVAATRNIVLVGRWDDTVLRSTDGGTTFGPVSSMPAPLVAGSVVFASGAAAGTHRAYALQYTSDDQHVVRSDDDGATWTLAAVLPNEILDTLGATLAIDAIDANRVYAGTSRGVHASSDGAMSFALLPRASGVPGATHLLVLDAVNAGRRWTTVPVDWFGRGFGRTIDGGATWTYVDASVLLLGASRVRTNVLYAMHGESGPFSVSADGGDTWSPRVAPIASGFSRFGPVGHGAVPGEVVVAAVGYDGLTNAESRRVFISVDDGESFVGRPAPPLLVRAFASTASAPTVLYAAGSSLSPDGPELWRSTDHALSWQPVHHFPFPYGGPPYGNEILAIAVDPSDPDRLYAGLSYPDHLMRSVDGGATWVRATAGLGAGAVSSIVVDPASPSTVFAGQYPSGVFRSTDYGQTWTALDGGLRDDSVRQVVLDPFPAGRLYAGTDSGLWQVDLSTGMPAGHRRAIEFYHAAFDHYFVSADLDEIAGLDEGTFAGWVRTGEGFRVGIPDARGRGFVPVCRFFGAGFAPLSSHFYTSYPDECEIVKGDPKWVYEKIAFGLALPDPVTHGCPPGSRPLYRAWNRNAGGAPNHRYNTDFFSVQNSVLRQGWILEGDARTLVFACVPV